MRVPFRNFSLFEAVTKLLPKPRKKIYNLGACFELVDIPKVGYLQILKKSGISLKVIVSKKWEYQLGASFLRCYVLKTYQIYIFNFLC